MTKYRGLAIMAMTIFAFVNCSFAASRPTISHTWGGSATDTADAVTIDSFGNIYVVGTTQSFGSGAGDALLLKYNSSGQFVWAKTWGGSGDEYGAAVKFGPDGYLYLTGGTSSFGAGWYDLFLVKLDTDGNVIWGTTWGGASFDGGHDIAFDATGNVYVVGESYSTSPCCSAVLLKFSPSGPLLNQIFYKGPATYDSGYSLAVDSNFNVIIAGISWDYSYNPLHNSILLLKFDPKGNLVWQENWSTAFPAQDESWAFHALTTDNVGNIYVGGRHSNQCQNANFGQCDFDGLLLKLDPNGNDLWAQTWGSVGTYDTAGSVWLNTTQAPVVSGVKDNFGAPSLFLLGYDANGSLLSQSGWQGGNIQSGSAPGMALDASGVPYLASSALNNQGLWASVTGNLGSLNNAMVSNSFSTGDPNLGVSALQTATVTQSSGVQDIGGGGVDVFVTKYQPRGNGIDLSGMIGSESEQAKFWNDAKNQGIEFAAVAAWGGGPGGYPWAGANLLGAQQKGIEIGTGAYALLNYFEDESGAYQIDQAIKAVGSAKNGLKFMAIDVEYCCGEFVDWKRSYSYKQGDLITDPTSHIQRVVEAGTSGDNQPAWNDSGGETHDGSVLWKDVHIFVSDPRRRVQWISDAAKEIVANDLTPVIYTTRQFWKSFAGDCSSNAESANNCSELIALKLWDAEPHCGDGIIGLTPFVEFPPKHGWVARFGNQYHYSAPGCQAMKIDGVPVDSDYFAPELFE